LMNASGPLGLCLVSIFKQAVNLLSRLAMKQLGLLEELLNRFLDSAFGSAQNDGMGSCGSARNDGMGFCGSARNDN